MIITISEVDHGSVTIESADQVVTVDEAVRLVSGALSAHFGYGVHLEFETYCMDLSAHELDECDD